MGHGAGDGERAITLQNAHPLVPLLNINLRMYSKQ